MTQVEKIIVPDIGGAEKVDVIEVLVKPGDSIDMEDALITLEGDKATMEVPSPLAGTVEAVVVKVGDKVSAGDLILQLKISPGTKTTSAATSHSDKDAAFNTSIAQAEVAVAAPVAVQSQKTTSSVTEKLLPVASVSAASVAVTSAYADVLAGPAARRLAREVGIDLTQIPSSNEKGRVTKEDVQSYIKQRMAGAGAPTAGFGLNLPPAPQIDFSKFGEVEVQALSKIKKISGAALHRNWVSIPHITQFGEADVTDMEDFRAQQKSNADKNGYKLTPLVFIMKAVVAALKKFPHFNASLDQNGTQIIVKKYFHLGVAVDTPNGLVVPVIRNVDQKGLIELAQELAVISKKAREVGLGIADMQGGCFTISSLGGIGGLAFTPIINAPEVAILGVSRAEMKPIYQANDQFVPRLMLPLSLSYDHRVIDGADGARFMAYLSQSLADIRSLLL